MPASSDPEHRVNGRCSGCGRCIASRPQMTTRGGNGCRRR